MESKLGYKETKELAGAVYAIAAVVAKELANGFQPGQDLVAIAKQLISNPEVHAKIRAGIDDAGLVLAEVNDTQADEAFDFAAFSVLEGHKIYKVLTGK